MLAAASMIPTRWVNECNGDVSPAIRPLACLELLRASPASVQQDVSIVIEVGGDYQINPFVAIKIRNYDSRGRSGDGEEQSGLQSSVAVAQEDSDVVGCKVERDDVGTVIAIEIANSYPIGIFAGANVNSGRLKGPIPVSQQDGDTAVGLAGSISAARKSDDQIAVAVTIEISDGDIERENSDKRISAQPKRSVSIAEKNGDSAD